MSFNGFAIDLHVYCVFQIKILSLIKYIYGVKIGFVVLKIKCLCSSNIGSDKITLNSLGAFGLTIS